MPVNNDSGALDISDVADSTSEQIFRIKLPRGIKPSKKNENIKNTNKIHTNSLTINNSTRGEKNNSTDTVDTSFIPANKKDNSELGFISDLGDPDKVHSTDEILRTLAQNKGEDLDTLVSKIEWKDYNPEKIVAIMFELLKIIAKTEVFWYQEIYIKRLFRSWIYNDGATVTYLVSRQSGKSFSTALAVVTGCIILPALAKIFNELSIYKRGFWVGVYAPSGEQAQTIIRTMTEFARGEGASDLYDDPSIGSSMEKYGLKWNNGSYIHSQSASNRSKLESKSFQTLILDESQDIDGDVVEKSLIPMLAWYNGSMCMIGTTTDKPSLFYETILMNRAENANIQDITWHKHFEFNYKEIVKHNPRYKNHIANMLKRHGYESRFFQMNYNLRWFNEEGLAITDEELKKFTMWKRLDILNYVEYNEVRPIVVGIDFARKSNSTIVTVGEIVKTEASYELDEDGGEVDTEIYTSVRILNWLELHDTPYPRQRPLIRQFLNQYSNIKYITVDSTGVGDSVFQEMQAEWDEYRNIMDGYIFSSSSKAYLKDIFHDFFFKYRLIVPSTAEARKEERWQNFYLQMITLTKVHKNGFIYYSKGNGQSARDDYPDSLFLMLYSAKVFAKKNPHLELSSSNHFSSYGLFSEDLKTPGSAKFTTFQGIRERISSGTFSSKQKLLTDSPSRNMREQRVAKLTRGII